MDTGESADTPISGLASGLANLGTADPAERGYSINETTNEEGYLIEGDDPSPSNKDEQDDQTDAHGESTPEAQSHKMAAPSPPAAAHLRHRAPPPRFSPSSPSADSILAAFVTCCRRRRRHAQQWDGGEEASQGAILPCAPGEGLLPRRPPTAPRRTNPPLRRAPPPHPPPPPGAGAPTGRGPPPLSAMLLDRTTREERGRDVVTGRLFPVCN
ncbi:Os02g0599850 [Oryza sativa Japonica Group]|uniref:Os02g0599850 protein n=1 Tax=Oryza sativa subsp. japonica TaxID=39947 RepID=A0A0N7KFM0_ORYSJ|nr:Os02g0599850 [Oryza sativa Japonica Group]